MKYDALSDIVKFNVTSGNDLTERPLDHELVKMYLNLIDEELNGKDELLHSYAKGDLSGVKDGAGDLIVVTAGLLCALGIHPNAVMREINGSNLSKFCKTEVDADRSVEAYQNDKRYFDVHWKKVGDVYVILGKKTDYPDGAYKILKGIDFYEPSL